MNNLQIIEHKNERVLLTSQLAEVYETTENSIIQNFKRNKDRFVEGRDFILLKGEELKKFLHMTNSHLQISNMTRVLYLWTERGANRHSKILDTDQAWKQFDVLEETYFKVKRMNSMELLKLQNKAIFELDERVVMLENNMTINTSQQYHLSRLAREKAIKVLGGKRSNAYLLYSRKVFSSLWRDYKECFKIPSYRDTLKNDYQKAKDYLKKWQPDFNLLIAIDEANNKERID